MASLTTRQLLDNVATLVGNVTDLVELPELLDPRDEPRTQLARGFSVTWSDTNSRQYRDRGDRSARLNYRITVRVGTQIIGGFTPARDAIREAADYRDDIVRAVCGDTTSTVDDLTIYYSATRSIPTPTREWLITEIDFDVAADLDL